MNNDIAFLGNDIIEKLKNLRYLTKVEPKIIFFDVICLDPYEKVVLIQKDKKSMFDITILYLKSKTGDTDFLFKNLKMEKNKNDHSRFYKCSLQDFLVTLNLNNS